MDDVGGAEGDRRGRDRRDGDERADRGWDPREHPHRDPADASPSSSPKPICSTSVHERIADAVARLVDPRDQPDRERDRDRVVAARLGLERPGDAPREARVPERREHGGRIGRRHDRAEQQRLLPA